jgi:ethanolamine ammonia-lyase small subunit
MKSVVDAALAWMEETGHPSGECRSAATRLDGDVVLVVVARGMKPDAVADHLRRIGPDLLDRFSGQGWSVGGV